MRRSTAFLLAAMALATAPRAAFAATSVAALDLGLGTAEVSSARDVSEAGLVYVQGPPALGGGASGIILLPPHPGGGMLVLPCSIFGSCFHVVDVPEGFAAGGRILGRRVSFGGVVRDANSSETFVGGLLSPTLGVGMSVHWSSLGATPATLANLASNAGPQPERINDAGVIIGNLATATPRAVRWASVGAASFVRLSGAGYTVDALPVPFAGGSCQEAIQPLGWVAGNCTKVGGDRRGVIWRVSGGVVTFEYELLPLPGETHSAVYALRGSALAAGSSGDPGRAVLWELAAAPVVPSLGSLGLLLLAVSLTAGVLRARRRAR